MLIPMDTCLPTNGRKFVKKCSLLTCCLLAVSVAGDAAETEFSGDIEVGYGYDSNVSVDDVDLNTNLGDQFSQLRFAGGFTRQPADDLKYTGNLTLSGKRYNRFNQFDGTLALASLSVAQDMDEVDLSASIRYIDYQLDNENFLSVAQIAPSISLFPDKKNHFRATYEFSDERYDRNADRDNTRHELGISYHHFMSGLRHYVNLQADWAQETATDRVFSNDAWQIRASYLRQFKAFSRDVRLKLGYRYQERDFDTRLNPLVGDFRLDQRHRYEVELNVPLNEHWSIETEALYSDYRSNLNAADYEQEVYQITLKYEW